MTWTVWQFLQSVNKWNRQLEEAHYIRRRIRTSLKSPGPHLTFKRIQDRHEIRKFYSAGAERKARSIMKLCGGRTAAKRYAATAIERKTISIVCDITQERHPSFYYGNDAKTLKLSGQELDSNATHLSCLLYYLFEWITDYFLFKRNMSWTTGLKFHHVCCGRTYETQL